MLFVLCLLFCLFFCFIAIAYCYVSLSQEGEHLQCFYWMVASGNNLASKHQDAKKNLLLVALT